MPLVDLSMVEQRYDAVREVLDGATVTDAATATGSTEGPFTAGSSATRTTVWQHWPTRARGPIVVLIRWRRRSRPASSGCAAPTPGGAPAQRRWWPMEAIVARAAGLDVHKNTVTACVRTPESGGGRPRNPRNRIPRATGH